MISHNHTNENSHYSIDPEICLPIGRAEEKHTAVEGCGLYKVYISAFKLAETLKINSNSGASQLLQGDFKMKKSEGNGIQLAGHRH